MQRVPRPVYEKQFPTICRVRFRWTTLSALHAMNTRAFIAQLVAALAWPLTVLTCVVLLRPLLVGLLPLIGKLRYSDVEIQFGQDVAELKLAAAASIQPATAEARQQPIWEDLTAASRCALKNSNIAGLAASRSNANRNGEEPPS